jgi:predicted nucleic acid-binding Zn ribbon protein
MRKKDNQQTIKDALEQMIRYYGMGPKLDEIKIGKLWDEHMGPMIARHTNNIFLKQGTLIVELDSAALKQELSYGKERIKKTMNEGLGKESVSEVIIR